jgi:hypothetical protein
MKTDIDRKNTPLPTLAAPKVLFCAVHIGAEGALYVPDKLHQPTHVFFTTDDPVGGLDTNDAFYFSGIISRNILEAFNDQSTRRLVLHPNDIERMSSLNYLPYSEELVKELGSHNAIKVEDMNQLIENRRSTGLPIQSSALIAEERLHTYLKIEFDWCVRTRDYDSLGLIVQRKLEVEKVRDQIATIGQQLTENFRSAEGSKSAADTLDFIVTLIFPNRGTPLEYGKLLDRATFFESFCKNFYPILYHEVSAKIPRERITEHTGGAEALAQQVNLHYDFYCALLKLLSPETIDLSGEEISNHIKRLPTSKA